MIHVHGVATIVIGAVAALVGLGALPFAPRLTALTLNAQARSHLRSRNDREADPRRVWAIRFVFVWLAAIGIAIAVGGLLTL